MGLPADLDSALTPWSYAVRDTHDMNRFGYEYVRDGCLMPVGLTNPVGRFVSAPIAVPDATKTFRSAEVRLHRVPQLLRSCFIRVFLNTPDADASRSMCRATPQSSAMVSVSADRGIAEFRQRRTASSIFASAA
jgi:hypothetical protein